MTIYTHPQIPGFKSPAPFVLGEGDDAVSYARGWWDRASEQEIVALGFVEYVSPEPEPPTLEERKLQMTAVINAKRDQILTSGYSVPSGPLEGKVLQTRDLEDRTNWLISQGSYAAAVAAGQGNVAGAKFRTQSNETITLTFEEGLAVLLEMAAWGAAVMERSWDLKDVVAAAEDHDDLDAIDIEAGWPA